MAQRVCIIGAGVVGLATAYALVREGFDVTLVEARERGGLETSYANGGQLSYRYVAPLADSGVPSSSSVMPSTPFMGVRISWLIFARKSPLACSSAA